MNAQVILGDCLEVMPTLPTQSVDMILADLPYGTTACAWDSVVPFAALWEQYERLIKPNGAIVLTAAQPFTTALIASRLELFKYCWIWEKSKGSDFLNAKNKPVRLHEEVCVFSLGTTANKSPRRMAYYPQGLVHNPKYHYRPGVEMKDGGVIGTRPSHKRGYETEWENYPTSILRFANPNNDLEHPTQKPVALFEYLIRTYTQPGDVVLDNTAGSGTTGVAAIQCGRVPILIERDEKYHAIAQRRVRHAQPALLGVS
ncbi:DNA-methyltransferase [Deinococcus humi]|uniref:Methyltransferase n=1 Tax=Deinococcus humi TaxID=662880 RepID=A0A7W8JQJ9_9DEIO|nr:site-specific DNA-methyltransferase [Deinococcus humi]MBB5361357.1 site-specific DNA-methyltransferase (adenine-specific) [Deinococcus humi]GGO19627.1 methyltransferase [Deinococcus humi]